MSGGNGRDVERGSEEPEGEEFEELRAAVSALREEIETRFGGRRQKPGRELPDWSAQLGKSLRDSIERLDLVELYEEVKRRFSVLGMEERIPKVDEFGMDSLYLARARGLLDFLYDRWWRIVATGAGAIPDAGAVLFIANRSGILPYDALMIAHAVEREGPSRTRPRFLIADWLLRLPFIQPALVRLGGVRACQENAERVLASGRSLVAFPEGAKGALKLFRDRYRLQRFGRGGFVSLAVRQRATIVPVGVVGAEEAHPILLRSSLTERLLGAPLPVTPTFSHFGPLGLLPLPTQWRIRFGEPVRFDGVPLERADDPLYVNRVREQIRGLIQTLLDEEVPRRSSIWS